MLCLSLLNGSSGYGRRSALDPGPKGPLALIRITGVIDENMPKSGRVDVCPDFSTFLLNTITVILNPSMTLCRKNLYSYQLHMCLFMTHW